MKAERVFVDTSAFYALMDRSDAHHAEAARVREVLLANEPHLITTNYVVVETMALLQSRLGFEAADLWRRDILRLIRLTWVDEAVHNWALELWMGLGRRKVSLVDCTSFVVMRRNRIEEVFGFDRHFPEQGFQCLEIS